MKALISVAVQPEILYTVFFSILLLYTALFLFEVQYIANHIAAGGMKVMLLIMSVFTATRSVSCSDRIRWTLDKS